MVRSCVEAGVQTIMKHSGIPNLFCDAIVALQ